MTEPPSASDRRSSIEVLDEERVVARGSAETVWFVRVEDAWVAAAQVTGARVTRLEAGPGTIWRRRVELELPRGNRLLKVESAPRPLTRTPLEYLTRTPGAPRKVRRQEFLVGPHGQLLPVR